LLRARFNGAIPLVDDLYRRTDHFFINTRAPVELVRPMARGFVEYIGGAVAVAAAASDGSKENHFFEEPIQQIFGEFCN
jgi:hypothetical protein